MALMLNYQYADKEQNYFEQKIIDKPTMNAP